MPLFLLIALVLVSAFPFSLVLPLIFIVVALCLFRCERFLAAASSRTASGLAATSALRANRREPVEPQDASKSIKRGTVHGNPFQRFLPWGRARNADALVTEAERLKRTLHTHGISGDARCTQ